MHNPFFFNAEGKPLSGLNIRKSNDLPVARGEVNSSNFDATEIYLAISALLICVEQHSSLKNALAQIYLFEAIKAPAFRHSITSEIEKLTRFSISRLMPSIQHISNRFPAF